MTDHQRRMKLGLNLVANGAHGAGWRMPDAQADFGMDFAEWKRLAQRAEAAKFHFIFWADGAAVRHAARDDDELSFNSRIDVFEPTTLASGLAAVTEHIGFICTASTTYNEPFNLARRFASIDRMSGGRIGWNVVTSWSEQEALNFNRDQHMEHGARYRRAQEFVDVVRGLWDSWEDDAFIRDKESGRYFDPEKLHNLDHKGEHFKVHGPLNTSRPIQGHPVLVQAGSSGPGQDLAARIGEVIYTSQKTREGAIAFYRSVKDRFAAYGRSPEQALVMPGMVPVLGRSDAEAQDRLAALQQHIHPRVGFPILTPHFGDLTGMDPDGPLPPLLSEHNGLKSMHERVRTMIEGQQLTIRELYMALATSDHHLLVGSAKTVADQMEDWFTNRACDGFNILPPYMPGPVEQVFDLLIPELQRRGLFQTEYQGGTLRENLGLERPAHPAAAARRSHPA